MHYYSQHYFCYHLANITETQKLSSVDKLTKIVTNVQTNKRPLGDRKTNFKLITYCYSSTNSANLVKIGPVDFTGLVKAYIF